MLSRRHVLAGGWNWEKASSGLFLRLKSVLLEKTLRSFPFFDGPNPQDFSKNLLATIPRIDKCSDTRKPNRAFFHGGVYCIILTHQLYPGHNLIYEDNHDSSCLIANYRQQEKKPRIQHGLP